MIDIFADIRHGPHLAEMLKFPLCHPWELRVQASLMLHLIKLNLFLETITKNVTSQKIFTLNYFYLLLFWVRLPAQEFCFRLPWSVLKHPGNNVVTVAFVIKWLIYIKRALFKNVIYPSYGYDVFLLRFSLSFIKITVLLFELDKSDNINLDAIVLVQVCWKSIFHFILLYSTQVYYSKVKKLHIVALR